MIPRNKKASCGITMRGWPLIILFLMGPALPLLCADGTILTLDQAVQIALQQNRDILLAQKEVIMAAGKTLQMKAVPDPSLVFRDEGLSGGTNRTGEGKEVSLGVEQSLEFPGKVSVRGKIGREGEEQAALELDRIRLLISSRVKKAYYRVVLAERTIGSLQETDALLEQFIKDLQVKYQAGAAAYVDILRAKVEKARLHNRILEEEKEKNVGRAALNTLLGRKGDELLRLETDMAFIPLVRTLSEVKEDARTSSPTLKALASKLRQAGLALTLSKMNNLPDFSVGVYYPSLRTGSWGISLGISLPLWRGKRKGETIEAKAANEMAILSLENEERRLEARIESAFAAAKAAEEQVRVFETTLLKDMEDELAMGLSRYQFGKIEFFNLLDLYRTFAAARLEHLSAVHLYLVSLADLEIAGEEQDN
jgi:cobalt-zinc-cadmium efflux system outer membrane protein